MLNFDEELKKFKPILNVNNMEDSINNEEIKDITDYIKLFNESLESYQKQSKEEGV